MSYIPPGGVMWMGNSIKSPNGRYVLQLQWDGNLVLVDYGVTPAKPLWAAGVPHFAQKPNPGYICVYLHHDPIERKMTLYNQALPEQKYKPFWTSDAGKTEPGWGECSFSVRNDGTMRFEQFGFTDLRGPYPQEVYVRPTPPVAATASTATTLAVHVENMQ